MRKYINVLNKRTGQFNLVPVDNFFKEPVDNISDLPIDNNIEGDCVLVKSINKMLKNY